MKSNWSSIARHARITAVWDKEQGGSKKRPKVARVRWYPETQAYVCNCEYDDRHIPKQAGFEWNAHGRYWRTTHPHIAHRLIDLADPASREQILRAIADK